MSGDTPPTLADLTARIERLEQLATESSAARSRYGAGEVTAGAPTHGDEFWALNGLEARRPDHPATIDGSVMIVGSLTLPTGAPVAWQQGAPTTGLLNIGWAEHAAVLSALGHPVRLELLRLILTGTSATSDLANTPGVGTTGQLHHHLRLLVAAGWVRQSGRGNYEVPAPRVIPLLACMTGAMR